MNNVSKNSFDFIYMAIHGHIWAAYHGPRCVCAFANCVWVGEPLGGPSWSPFGLLCVCVFVVFVVFVFVHLLTVGGWVVPLGHRLGRQWIAKYCRGMFAKDCFHS